MSPRSLITLVTFLSLGCCCAPAWAQARYNVHFQTARVSGGAGQVVTMGIGLDNQPEKVTGFSFGVKHDAAKLSVQSVDIGPDLQAALGSGVQPDDHFYFVNLAPGGGVGFTVAMVLSADKPGVAIAAGLDHHIFDVKYKLPDLATGDTKIDITGDLGVPKVGVLLDVNNGTSQKPAGAAGLTSATVSVSTGPAPFLRGDADQSGSFNIIDAIILIDYLFSGGTYPPGAATRTNCLVVLNFDGSVGKTTPDVEASEDIDLTDALGVLNYVFQRGLPPPPPFPGCGQPTSAASAEMSCKEFLCR